MNDDLTSKMDHQMERLTLEDKRQLRGFSLTFGASVRQHTVMKLQYEVLFATRDVVAVKHARRGEQFSFFLPW